MASHLGSLKVIWVRCLGSAGPTMAQRGCLVKAQGGVGIGYIYIYQSLKEHLEPGFRW